MDGDLVIYFNLIMFTVLNLIIPITYCSLTLFVASYVKSANKEHIAPHKFKNPSVSI